MLQAGVRNHSNTPIESALPALTGGRRTADKIARHCAVASPHVTYDFLGFGYIKRGGQADSTQPRHEQTWALIQRDFLPMSIRSKKPVLPAQPLQPTSVPVEPGSVPLLVDITAQRNCYPQHHGQCVGSYGPGKFHSSKLVSAS